MTFDPTDDATSLGSETIGLEGRRPAVTVPRQTVSACHVELPDKNGGLMARISQMIFAYSALLSMGAVSATTINFDSLPDDSVVTNQFAGVTFSSISGYEVRTTAQSFGSSLPNIICSAEVGGAQTCGTAGRDPFSSGIPGIDDIFVDFSTPVNNLSFLAVGDNDNGNIGVVDVFEDAILAGQVNIVGNSNGLDPFFVDLTGFNNVTRVTIHSITDTFGLGFDDFTFASATVPIPATLYMFGSALGLLGWIRRKAI